MEKYGLTGQRKDLEVKLGKDKTYNARMIVKNPHPRIYLLILEREGKEKKNINVRDKHQLVASWACPDLGWCPERCSNQLSHPARAMMLEF